MIVVADGVLEKEVAKIRGSNQSDADEKHAWDCNRGKEYKSSFFHDNNRSDQHSQSGGLDDPKTRAGQLSTVRRDQGYRGLSFVADRGHPLSKAYSADYNVGQSSGGQRMLMGSRDVLERALIFLLFLRRRRDLFFFHFSRILCAGVRDRGERAQVQPNSLVRCGMGLEGMS
jgi:hypothetical protein